MPPTEAGKLELQAMESRERVAQELASAGRPLKSSLMLAQIDATLALVAMVRELKDETWRQR